MQLKFECKKSDQIENFLKSKIFSIEKLIYLLLILYTDQN